MSESWKNRFWSLLLVCTFAVVLSVCNKAIDSSSGGIAYADFKPSDISAVMFCDAIYTNSSKQKIFSLCDASYTTNLSTITDSSGSDREKSILLDDAISSGWRPCGSRNTYRDFFLCK